MTATLLRAQVLAGAALLGLTSINTRWLLAPRATYHDPAGAADAGSGAYLWWALTDTAADETCLWLAAIAAGLLLCHKGPESAGTAWTTAHRARMLTLAAAGGAVTLFVWPGDPLLPGAFAALLVSGALRSPSAAPWRLALVAGLVPIALATKGLVEWHALVRDAKPDTTWDPFALTNPWYDEWQSAAWAGDAAARRAVRREALSWAYGRMLPERWLWQAGSGLFIACWWLRKGRTLIREPHARALTGTGLVAAAAAVCATEAAGHTGLALRIADLTSYAAGAVVALGATAWLGTASETTVMESPTLARLAAMGRGALTGHLAATAALACAAQGWGLGLHGTLGADGLAAASAATVAGAAALAWAAGRNGPGPAERVWLRAADSLISAARS